MSQPNRVLSYLGVYRDLLGRRLYLVFVLALLTVIVEGFGITLLLPLLDAVQGGEMQGDPGTAGRMLYRFVEWVGVDDSLLGIVVLITSLFVTKGVIRFSKKAYEGFLDAQLTLELRRLLFDLYASMKYEYFTTKSTGHFINVISTQTGGLIRSFHFYMTFATHVIMTTGYLAFAVLLAWRFTAIVAGLGIGAFLLFRKLTQYVQDISRHHVSEESTLNELLVQSLQGFKYLVGTGEVTRLRDHIVGSLGRLRGFILRKRVAEAFTASVKEPASAVIVTLVIAIQVLFFQEPIGPILIAILLLHRSMQSAMGIQASWQHAMSLSGAVDTVVDEIEAARHHREPSGSHVPGPLSDGIQFHHVTFSYASDEGRALDDVSLSIAPNTTVALVGESGAGKSTLADMITLMLRPTSGTLTINGVSADEIDTGAWRARLGYVSQETVVFDDSVANNISLWGADYDDPDARQRIHDAARRAHAHDFIENLENGYQTQVGDRGVRLSGGQRQRLFIARELYKDPDVLILDEATSALDTQSERYIQESIDDLKGTMTVVIIAHRLSTLRNADHVFVLDDGRVVEDGTFDNLRDDESSRFRHMVEIQNL